MESNETLVYEIQQSRAAGDTNRVEELTKKIFDQNTGLIYETSLAYKNKYAKCQADREDMDSVAMIAFNEAIYTYNPSKGTSFASWAKFNAMEFALRDYVRENKLIKIPVRLQALIKLHDEIVETYKEAHNGSMPSDKFILIEMNKRFVVSPERLKDIRAGKQALAISSIDAPIDNNDTTEEAFIGMVDYRVEIDSPEEVFFAKEEKRTKAEAHIALRKMIQRLPQDEQDVLKMVYFEGKKQTEVAELLGKRKQYVNKKMNQAYSHLLKMKEIRSIGKDKGWLLEK